MLAEYARYALIGFAVAVGFGVLSWVCLRYERGRRQAYERMTPEERREESVFRRGVFKRR